MHSLYWEQMQWSEAKVFEIKWDCKTARGSPWAAPALSQEYWTAAGPWTGDLCGYLRSNADLRSLIEPRLCWQQKQWDAQETSQGWIYREPHEGPECTSTSSRMWICKQLCNPPSSLNHGPEFMLGSDVLASNFPCVYTAKWEVSIFAHRSGTRIFVWNMNKHLLTLEQLLTEWN